MRRLISFLMLITLIATPAVALAAQTPAPPMDTPTPSIAQATTPPAAAPRPGQATTLPATAPRAVQTAPPRASAPPTGLAALPQMPVTTNVRLDMTITDTFTGTPVKKTVSLIVQTGNSGRIRTTNWANTARSGNVETTLNVDASATAYLSSLVRVQVTFEYTPVDNRSSEAVPTSVAPRLNESISVFLQDGKPLIVSQSADPISDRKVTVELTATILK